MKPKLWILWAALIGGFTAIPVAGILYIGNQVASLPFAPFDWFDWLARVLPGGVVTFGIDAMVAVIRSLQLGPTSTTAKLGEQILALLQFAGAGALSGIILAIVHDKKPGRWIGASLALALVFWIITLFIQSTLGYEGPVLVLGALWTAAVFTLWQLILSGVISLLLFQREIPADTQISRRRFLRWAGLGMAGLLGSVIVVGALRRRPQPVLVTGEVPLRQEELMAALERTSGPAASPPAGELEARIEPAPGTRMELTPIDQFYRIDINTRAPAIDGENWRLKISGLVDHPLELSLQEIRRRPSIDQVATLSCISNPVAGDLISTALWTGVRFREILQEAGLKPGVRELYITAEDGFYESVPIDEAMDERTLLVFAMNQEPLTADHGFPLRIFIPNHFGMKQPKWIQEIEAVPEVRRGYWVERGWSERAIVRTTSVIDTIAIEAIDPESSSIPVGGIAYAGARGISRVEVQVDESEWTAAELRAPGLSSLSWVQWRYDWMAEPGRHSIRVRAFDGNQEPQEVEFRDVRPDGATGIHNKIVDVNL
jgi:DMSO/TMAO reductase YedYZ molybdopterin-dependent catalytic subunit